MRVIGLAGKAGCGKSAVASELTKRVGVVWIELDAVARETYRPRTAVYWQLVSRFGQGILDEAGQIDRGRLADIVFSDAKALADLNRIVHPQVNARLREIIRAQERHGTKWLLVEGALLAASPHVDRSLFDIILWFEVSEAVRRARLKRSGRTAHAKRSLSKPTASAAVLVNAGGSVQDVVRRVESLLGDL